MKIKIICNVKKVSGLLLMFTLFVVTKSDYYGRPRRLNHRRIYHNQEYNEVLDRYDLQTAIDQQLPKGVAKFFDINDFDCEFSFIIFLYI